MLCPCLSLQEESPCGDYSKFIACLCAEDGYSADAGLLLPG